MKKKDGSEAGERPGGEPVEAGAEGPAYNPTRRVHITSSLLPGGGETSGGERVKVLTRDPGRVRPEDFLCPGGDEKYEVGRQAAEGGMGVVYEVRDVNCRRTVAMKVLREEAQNRPEELVRFIEEAQITSQLEHPNIVPVHDLGIDHQGRVYYTMKYVRGMTLAEVLEGIRRGDGELTERFPLRRLLDVFQRACDAIAFAHSRGVIHRDLKPDNIMIGDYGEVWVMDWGLAKVLGEEKGEAGEEGEDEEGGAAGGERETPRIDSIRTDRGTGYIKTMSGRVMGTPGFMAPEQVDRSRGAVTPAVDVYSLGAILYCILVLRAPVTGKSVKKVLGTILRGEIPPPVDFNADGPEGRKRKGAARRLPHCPGGRVPEILSEAAMKAMAVDPAQRYADVRALQREIEEYLAGRIWRLVVDEDLSGEDFFERWEVIGGRYELREGELRVYGGEPQILLLKKDLPGDVRIEFECRQESPYLNDLGCFMSAVPSGNRREVPSSGYEFKYGGYENSSNVLMRSNFKLWSEPASPLVRGRTYRIRAERVGSHLRMVVDGVEVLRVEDPDPLSGAERTAVGLQSWRADTRYRRIKIYTLGIPYETDVLDMAERQLRKGHYATAMDLFEEVLESFPEARRRERARRGYHTAWKRGTLDKMLPVWRERLERAWPDSGVQVRVDNDGLTVEINDAGIEDLSPLAGMPLNALYCVGNRIRSLEPLRGMKLLTLNCSGNPIEDLSPLAGMPLKTLICEQCRISSLAPLAGTPLTMLNCGGNPLADGLEPLRGLPLSWLSCWGCGVERLDALEGMPLTALYCAGNQLRSLAPVRGMRLAQLHCSGNAIEDLSPLAGMPLVNLYCADNVITDLGPLEGMPLTILSCHCNRIRSLAPLYGMGLDALTCGGNRLVDLGAFIKNPPYNFHFDCDTMETRELEWLQRKWSRDFRYRRHAREVETLIALRRRDVRRLRQLAERFRKRRYLMIPVFLEWEAARQAAEELGGRLVCIGSSEEHEFINSLFPRGSWFWIGLYGGEEGLAWVNGMPVEFTAFNDVVCRRRRGPKVFFSGIWACETYEGAHNTFMVEWD